jgi:hypothetical protein
MPFSSSFGEVTLMRVRRNPCLFFLLALAGTAASAQPASSPPLNLESPRPEPRFEAEISPVPDLQPWGHAAEALCQVWYPKIVGILHSDDSYRPLPAVVKLVFEKEMRGVAYSGGGEIHISANWVRSHPNDFGMVIHELTHLVQRYPRNPTRAGWLVEGIADYVRLEYFEPLLPRPAINFAKANYTDAYKTTAQFLIWLEGKYGADLVPRLNAALRAGRYTDAVFKEITGKEVAQLWSDFAASPTPTKPAPGQAAAGG